jgi:hypothetical protein
LPAPISFATGRSWIPVRVWRSGSVFGVDRPALSRSYSRPFSVFLQRRQSSPRFPFSCCLRRSGSVPDGRFFFQPAERRSEFRSPGARAGLICRPRFRVRALDWGSAQRQSPHPRARRRSRFWCAAEAIWPAVRSFALRLCVCSSREPRSLPPVV